MLLVVVLCLLTLCVIGAMYFFTIIKLLLLNNLANILKSFWCGGCHPLLGTAQGHIGKKNICVSGGGDAELIGVTSAWYYGFGWSDFVGWGVILLLCIPLVAGKTLKSPIQDHTSDNTSFLALGLVFPCVVPYLGGYCALGSLSKTLTWGIPVISAVFGFNSQALYQDICYWFGYRPYSRSFY